MTIQIIRGAEVNRPTPEPLQSSVLDHATVVDKADFGLRNNQGLWPSYNCLDTLTPAPLCPDPLMGSEEGTGFKEFSTAGWTPAFATRMPCSKNTPVYSFTERLAAS